MPDFKERFTQELHSLLEETFENVHGIYLDKGTSLCETLAGLTAEQASKPISPKGTSVAAHVSHTDFYIDLLARGLRGEEIGKVDWEETWRVTSVSPVGWSEMQAHLRQTYQTLLETLRGPQVWESKDAIGDAMAIVAHTAYHLGAIRQILCVL